ncbi:MAG: sypB, partial [Gammaproteobacteria bacterium]|nr:sypB [Gammaproteobacteria bacterium]
DPAYPPERLQYMLRDSAPRVVLTQASVLQGTHQPWLSQLQGRAPVIDLSAASPPWSVHPGSNPDRRSVGLLSTHLAYVIYTSGSTGQPKGVVIEHCHTVALINWAQRVYGASALSGVLAATSICFDLSVFELFVPLCSGGSAVVVDHALDVVGITGAKGLTLINTVPSAMRTLLKEGAVPASVKVVNLAGEALDRELVQQVYRRTSATAVYNLYGPSEDTTYSTCALIERDDQRVPSIGRPISNTQVYILGAHGASVPVGVAGEIYIGGAGVARGYLNRTELTAERFLQDPFSADPKARMYRTGDLGRWRADGNIEYLGRNDFQVKIRGFRIELGEIESRLVQHPSVREAVVLAREDSPGDKRLVAYVTAAELHDTNTCFGAQLDFAELRRHLSALLPEYMMPAAFVSLSQLPLTTNGKLNRKALPAPGIDAYAAHEYEEPQGEIERQLAQVWSEVLNIVRVGRHDSFFALGGNSLSAMLAIERMRREGLRADVRTLFAKPTLSALAAVIATATAAIA